MNEEFNDIEPCLGYEIDVYHDSIGHSFTEYLVNMNYLIYICSEKYNLKLITDGSNSFSSLYLTEPHPYYEDAHLMTDELKRYSSLNKYFIFEKF